MCNNRNAKGINYAKKKKTQYLFVLVDSKFNNFDNKILYFLKKYKISLICLAGYMKIISKNLSINLIKK